MDCRVKPGNDGGSLRRDHAQPLGLALRTRLVAPEPDLHAVEIKINDRRGVERQQLAQRETADHGVAERLTQLRARAVTEGERYAREHRGRRRHQDRAEAQQAGFADRRDRRHVMVAFGHDRKVDQHDAVLLDDADQENDADDADHREIHVAELQRQQRADAGRRQRGENRQRMDEALVEYAEDDVDDDERRGDQRRFARERGLEGLRVALEGSDHRRRHADLARGLGHRLDGFAQRHAGLQVEAQRDGRELALVRDRQRPNLAGIDLDQRGERHGGAGERRFHVQAIERGEVALLVGRDLEDDPISLELGEILRDLALAEGVVEGVVDQLRRDAEARGLVAVDGDLELRGIRQEIARHVGELRQRAHLLEQLLRPFVELGDVGVLQRVLKTGAGNAGADGDVLRRLQKERRALNFGELRPQPVDNLRGGELALVARLEHDEETPGVGGVGAAGAAGERAEAGDVRIAQQHRAKLAQDAHRLLGRRILGGFGKALDDAGVLDREEALRNLKGHDHGQRHRGEEHTQRDRLMAEHYVERAPVERQHRIEAGFDDAVDAAVVFRFAMHEARAQHRREREQDQRRHRDRGGDGEREFAEHAPDDAAHQQERDEHRHQRQADRQHGEADLARALERGLERRSAILDVAVDVLHHHDGVVDHEADGDGERHQRQIVEAEVEHVHRRARAEQRQRHGYARNDRGPEVAQEQQDDQHHEGDGEPERELDVVDGGANGGGAVEDGFDLDRGRNPGGQLGKLRLDLVDRIDDVGAGLLEDGQYDAAVVVLIGGDGAVDRRFDRLADVAHPDRRAVAIGEDDVVETLGRGDLIVGGDGEADLVGVDRAFSRAGGGGDERAADLFQRYAGRCELGRIDLDADRRRRVAEDRDLGNAGHLRYLLGEEQIAVIVDRGHRHRLRAQRQHDDGRVRRVDLLVARRRGHIPRQGLARDRDRRLHVLSRRVDVAVEIELNDDRGGAERAQRRELGDAGDLRELPLERRGDRGGHGLRACALKRGGDLNGGKIHLR